jgi:hypothetical protein
MAEDQLSSLSVYSIEYDTAKRVTFDDVISDFAGNKRRLVVF